MKLTAQERDTVRKAEAEKIAQTIVALDRKARADHPGQSEDYYYGRLQGSIEYALEHAELRGAREALTRTAKLASEIANMNP